MAFPLQKFKRKWKSSIILIILKDGALILRAQVFRLPIILTLPRIGYSIKVFNTMGTNGQVYPNYFDFPIGGKHVIFTALFCVAYDRFGDLAGNRDDSTNGFHPGGEEP
jgi:hypothetical protein